MFFSITTLILSFFVSSIYAEEKISRRFTLYDDDVVYDRATRSFWISTGYVGRYNKQATLFEAREFAIRVTKAKLHNCDKWYIPSFSELKSITDVKQEKFLEYDIGLFAEPYALIWTSDRKEGLKPYNPREGKFKGGAGIIIFPIINVENSWAYEPISEKGYKIHNYGDGPYGNAWKRIGDTLFTADVMLTCKKSWKENGGK